MRCKNISDRRAVSKEPNALPLHDLRPTDPGVAQAHFNAADAEPKRANR